MKKAAIFGASVGGKNAYKHLKGRDNLELVCFVDNDPQKQGTQLKGLPIISPDQLADLNCDYIFIASVYVEEIKQQLLDMGFESERIHVLSPSVINDPPNIFGCMGVVGIAAVLILAAVYYFFFK